VVNFKTTKTEKKRKEVTGVMCILSYVVDIEDIKLGGD